MMTIWSRCVLRASVPFLLCLFATAQITVQGGTLDQKTAPANSSQSQYPAETTLEFDMTPDEAAHLLASVDEVIAFDSKVTGLPVLGHVDRQITSRDEIRALATKRSQDAKAMEKVQRSAAVLKKIGYVPRDFDLQQFGVDHVVNQLAGYYDPRAKKMYLLNWLPAGAQLPVMAHELDHALQDQSFDLQKWLTTDDPSANDATGGDNSEQRGARRAVLEGHATAVMIEYMLSRQGRSLAQLPALSPEAMQKNAERFSPASTQSAPQILRDQVNFPYMYGMAFVHQVLLRAGKQAAFSGVFKRPPENTRQIMEPEAYLAHEKLPALPMPELLDVIGKEYVKIENGSLGEFDCMELMKQFDDPQLAKEISRDWRGDYFFAVTRSSEGGEKADRAAPTLRPEDVSLVLVSRWATPAAARAFAGSWRRAVQKRYPDAKPASEAQPADHSAVESWETSEGKVTIHLEGNLVIDTESFEDTTAARILAAVVKADK